MHYLVWPFPLSFLVMTIYHCWMTGWGQRTLCPTRYHGKIDLNVHMSIITFLLGLIGLAVVPMQTQAPVPPSVQPSVVAEVGCGTVPAGDSFTACQTRHHYARLSDRILEGKTRVQPIIAMKGANSEALKSEWAAFAKQLPYHLQFVMLPPRITAIDSTDIIKGEAFSDTLDVGRLMAKVGDISEHALPVVYWDFDAVAFRGYDWEQQAYMRFQTSMLEQEQTRYDEQLFLEWLVFTHN